MAKILGFVDSAQDTVDWPTSPALGIKTILEQLKLKVEDVASYEINEAFSVVILANAKLLGLNLDKVSSKISSHFMYRILDSKKTSHFQFSVPGLLEIHRNLKQQKNFNSCDGFFRKSPFCTFSCMNPGFGGPWDML